MYGQYTGWLFCQMGEGQKKRRNLGRGPPILPGMEGANERASQNLLIMCVSEYGYVHMSEGAFAGRGIRSPGTGTKCRSISPTLEKRIFMSQRLGLLVWHQLVIGSFLCAARAR